MSFHPRPDLVARLAGASLRAGLLAALGLAWLCAAAARGGYFDRPLRDPLEARPEEVLVLDGDTIRVRGRDLRFLAVDAPETGGAWYDGAQEPWGGRARDLVRSALACGWRVTVLPSGVSDRYGRDLVHVLVDGRSLSVALAEAGLAHETVSRYGDGGFPELAAEVLRRARPPAFEPPWEWRRRHRRPDPD